MKKIIYKKTEIEKAVDIILNLGLSKNICFYGAMGAGKTTLIKALVSALGAEEGNSPTFGIVNEYHNPTGEKIGYHFDFYRLQNEIEALDMGFEEYLTEGLWIFIEWPEKIASFLPEPRIEVKIRVLDDESRELHISNQT